MNNEDDPFLFDRNPGSTRATPGKLENKSPISVSLFGSMVLLAASVPGGIGNLLIPSLFSCVEEISSLLACTRPGWVGQFAYYPGAAPVVVGATSILHHHRGYAERALAPSRLGKATNRLPKM